MFSKVPCTSTIGLGCSADGLHDQSLVPGGETSTASALAGAASPTPVASKVAAATSTDVISFLIFIDCPLSILSWCREMTPICQLIELARQGPFPWPLHCMPKEVNRGQHSTLLRSFDHVERFPRPPGELDTPAAPALIKLTPRGHRYRCRRPGRI